MTKYKIAYNGWTTAEVEANSPEEAEDKFWEEGLNDLHNAEIEEIVEANKGFEMYTDLN